MEKSYYTDQNIERFVFRSEKNLKHMFCVVLIGSIICQPCAWFMMAETKEGFSFYCLLICSVLGLVSLFGLWCCYYSAKRERLNYEKLKDNK